MEELESIMKEIEVTKYEANTEHWVHVIHVINPHNFYVRPTKFKVFVEKLQSMKPTNQTRNPHDDDYVIYDMDMTGKKPKYARGKVLYVEPGMKCNIFALDYGFLHRLVPRERVWVCDPKLANIPPLALCCQLAHCAAFANREWSEDTIDAFKFYTGSERAKMYIIDKTFERLIVELFNSNPGDIATLLALTGYSTLGYVHNAVNKLDKEISEHLPQILHFKYKTVNQNDTLHVRAQGGKSLQAFYVAEVKDYHTYMSEYSELTECTNKAPKILEENFKVNTPVCLKNFYNNYDRGVINEVIVPGTKAIVKLVDTGREVAAHISDMRMIPNRFMKIPTCAIFCTVDETSKDKFDLNRRFLVCGYEFLIKIKAVAENRDLPNVVKIMPLQGGSSRLRTKMSFYKT